MEEIVPIKTDRQPMVLGNFNYVRIRLYMVVYVRTYVCPVCLLYYSCLGSQCPHVLTLDGSKACFLTSDKLMVVMRNGQM